MKGRVEVRAFEAMVAFAQQVQRAAESALSDADISPAQFFVLAWVARHGAMQQSDLAQALGVTAANVSQLVSKLDDARLVTREDQGKAKLVGLTDKGRTLVNRLAPEHDEFLASRFAALTAAERKTLLALLEKLVSDTNKAT